MRKMLRKRKKRKKEREKTYCCGDGVRRRGPTRRSAAVHRTPVGAVRRCVDACVRGVGLRWLVVVRESVRRRALSTSERGGKETE